MAQQKVDAIAALLFNVGDLSAPNVGPNTWAALLAGNFDRYLIEASEIRFSGGVELEGLADRRADEAELFTQNDYTRSFDHINGVAGSDANPYTPGNWSGTRDQPSGISAEWVIGDQNRECFPADTLIAMWPADATPRADGTYDQTAILAGLWQKPIEDITPADIVVAHDANGNLAPGRVTQLLHNTTGEWLHLPNGTVITPGHRFLRSDGSCEEIGVILAQNGQIALEDGSATTVTAKRVVYVPETAHFNEEANNVVYANDGGAVLSAWISADGAEASRLTA